MKDVNDFRQMLVKSVVPANPPDIDKWITEKLVEIVTRTCDIDDTRVRVFSDELPIDYKNTKDVRWFVTEPNYTWFWLLRESNRPPHNFILTKSPLIRNYQGAFCFN